MGERPNFLMVHVWASQQGTWTRPARKHLVWINHGIIPGKAEDWFDFIKVYESMRSCVLISFWFLGAYWTVETMMEGAESASWMANWMEPSSQQGFWATKIFMDAIVAEPCIMNPWLLRTFLVIFCSRFRLEPIPSGSQKPAWFQILRPSGMTSNWSQASGLLGYEREVSKHWSPQPIVSPLDPYTFRLGIPGRWFIYSIDL